MTDIDISREAVEREFPNTKQPHGEMLRALRAALDAAEARTARPEWMLNCAVCGRIVDTREPSDGGDGHGCEYADGWVCSSACAEILCPDPSWMKSAPSADKAQPEPDVIGAAWMREQAVQTMLTSGDSAVTEALGQRICCNAQHCGCQGATVEDYLADRIRAIPLPSDPLTAALALPEIAEVVKTARKIRQWASHRSGMNYQTDADYLEFDNALAALPKGVE